MTTPQAQTVELRGGQVWTPTRVDLLRLDAGERAITRVRPARLGDYLNLRVDYDAVGAGYAASTGDRAFRAWIRRTAAVCAS